MSKNFWQSEEKRNCQKFISINLRWNGAYEADLSNVKKYRTDEPFMLLRTAQVVT